MARRENCIEIERIKKLEQDSQESKINRGIMAEKIVNIEKNVKEIKDIVIDLPTKMDSRYVQKVEFKAELSKLIFTNQIQDNSLKFLQSQYYKIAEKLIILSCIVAALAKIYGLW